MPYFTCLADSSLWYHNTNHFWSSKIFTWWQWALVNIWAPVTLIKQLRQCYSLDGLWTFDRRPISHVSLTHPCDIVTPTISDPLKSSLVNIWAPGASMPPGLRAYIVHTNPQNMCNSFTGPVKKCLSFCFPHQLIYHFACKQTLSVRARTHSLFYRNFCCGPKPVDLNTFFGGLNEASNVEKSCHSRASECTFQPHSKLHW